MSEISSIDKLLNPNSKDEPAQSFQRLHSQDSSAKVGGNKVAENMKLKKFRTRMLFLLK